MAATLKLPDKDMVLEAPAFGTRSRGLAENEAALTKFFRNFPYYSVELEDHASDGETLVCWGTVRMTMTGDRFGVVPNGRRAQLPVFIHHALQNVAVRRRVCRGADRDFRLRRQIAGGRASAHRLQCFPSCSCA